MILNNTKGYLPQIHAISNLSVVCGPINFFEPLAVGTPAVLIGGRDGHFSVDGLHVLRNIALKTGGAAVAESIEQIDRRFMEVFSRKRAITPPWETKIDGDKTALEVLLELIEEEMKDEVSTDGVFLQS